MTDPPAPPRPAGGESRLHLVEMRVAVGPSIEQVRPLGCHGVGKSIRETPGAGLAFGSYSSGQSLPPSFLPIPPHGDACQPLAPPPPAKDFHLQAAAHAGRAIKTPGGFPPGVSRYRVKGNYRFL